ncbi:hypothetical protein [Streptomyces sp. NPDC050388]
MSGDAEGQREGAEQVPGDQGGEEIDLRQRLQAQPHPNTGDIPHG